MYEYPVLLKIHNPVWKYVVPYADSIIYKSALEIFSFDIRSEAWLNHFWKYINEKLFCSVYKTGGDCVPRAFKSQFPMVWHRRIIGMSGKKKRG